VKPKKKGDFALYFSEKREWFRFVKKEVYEDVYQDLDVQYVTHHIIENILGITDFTNVDKVEYYPGGKYPLQWYKGISFNSRSLRFRDFENCHH
jgi:uncharacterized protein (DUF1015 family)